MKGGPGGHDPNGSTGSPDAPPQLPYAAKDAKADLRKGHLDGRRRIPSYTQLSERIERDGWFITAYSEELQELGNARIHDELHAYRRQEAPMRQRVAGLQEQLAATIDKIARTQEALSQTATELTPEELIPRNPQESQRGPDFIRSRRTMMRDRRAQRARDQLVALNGEADDIRRQIAETCERIEQDFERAKVRARMQAARTELRVTTYWRALTETHPEGRQLTVVLPRIHRTLPAWLEASATDVTDDDEGPSQGLAG